MLITPFAFYHIVTNFSIGFVFGAQVISAGSGENSRSEISALKKERSDLDGKINNLVDALSNGLNSPAVQARLTEFEGKRQILNQKIKELRPKPTLSRDYLIKELSKDAEKLEKDPACVKELLHKYIVKIDIFDDAIEIYSTADFSSALPAGGEKIPMNAKSTEKILGTLSGIGCGGPQLVPLKFRIPRPLRKTAYI